MRRDIGKPSENRAQGNLGYRREHARHQQDELAQPARWIDRFPLNRRGLIDSHAALAPLHAQQPVVMKLLEHPRGGGRETAPAIDRALAPELRRESSGVRRTALADKGKDVDG